MEPSYESSNVADDYSLCTEEVANIHRGYKATLSNPNVSEEAKQHAREQLKKINLNPDFSHGTVDETGGKDPARVEGGLKATLHNPNVSDDAKAAAQMKLDAMQS